MARPMRLDGTSGIQEMSDGDLERLVYYTQVAYATQLNSNSHGSIYLGSGNTGIGSANDTSSTQQTNQNTRDYNPSTGQDWPSYPGIGVETDTTYNYRQRRTFPSAPSNATLNDNGYVVLDGTSGVRVATEAEIFNTVVTQTINAMRNGDEVGTYRVSTSAPSGGTWTNKGNWFTDTTYSAGSTSWNLWLKTSGTIPGALVRPLIVNDTNNGLCEAPGASINTIVNNILLPILTRRINNGDLLYTVVTSDPGGVHNRGSWTNTRQLAASDTQWFSNPTYFRRSTPSGGSTVVNSHWLRLA